MEENKTQDMQIANIDKQLAVTNTKLDSLNRKVDEFSLTTNKLLDIVDKKVNREDYLSDKASAKIEQERMETRVGKLETFRSAQETARNAKSEERGKIWGVGKESLNLILTIFTLISVVVGLALLFNQT